MTPPPSGDALVVLGVCGLLFAGLVLTLALLERVAESVAKWWRG